MGWGSGRNPLVAVVAMFSLLVSACGGGGDSGGSTFVATGGGSTGTIPPATPASCSLRDRQDWAAAQLREWYLFPETLPASLNPAGYTTVDDYIDALTANARSQNRDRYFTYLTSIAEEDAYYDSGNSAGFGFRLATNLAARTVMVTELFENGPAFYSTINRGSRITAIGTAPSNMRLVSDILATEGEYGLAVALGPPTPGTVRSIRFIRSLDNNEGTVTLTKGNYTLEPVSSRYGVKIFRDDIRPVGYLNLRTFINTADAPLRAAFSQFRTAGITDYIIDLRYNGGGLVSTAELLTRLLGGNRAASDVLSRISYRPEKSARNSTSFFQPQPESVSPVRIAFITTGDTASASEFVINAMIPYLRANVAIVGSNTYGKPVGQIAIDRVACDDRLRVVAFATENSARNSNYYNGLATTVEASCSAVDGIDRDLGTSGEASISAARDFLFGRGCNRIASSRITVQSANETGRNRLLMPKTPTPAQRDQPGLF